MNKIKAEIERRKILNLIRPSNLHSGALKFYSNETKEHKYKKFLVFTKLQENGYEVFSEVIFKSGKRCDVLGIKEGKAIGIEILESETEEMYEEKIKNYPEIIEWKKVKDLKDIENLI
jgi:hypothetical protein